MKGFLIAGTKSGIGREKNKKVIEAVKEVLLWKDF